MTVYGYDGNGYGVGDRVELHPGTDLWMRGARFGVVVGMGRGPNTDYQVDVKLDLYPLNVHSACAWRFRRAE